MLVYQKKVLLKQKIIGINFLFLKSLIKILSLFVVLFFLGCDFRIPQDWETPEWEFDLSIPLINEEYLMASIASSSNDIEIAPPDSSDFIISINEPIIEEGDIVVDPSFFIIDETSFELPVESILFIPNPTIDVPIFSQSIGITDLIGQDIPDGETACVPVDFLNEDINLELSLPIPSFCTDFDDTLCLDSITSIITGPGDNSLDVINGFPFNINSFILNVDDIISIDETISDIPFNDFSSFDNEILGCEINASIGIQINSELELNDNYQQCDVLEFLCVESGNLFLNDECYFLLEGLTQIECGLGNFLWENGSCYAACTTTSVCCEAVGGSWDNSNCTLPSSAGFIVEGDEELTIINDLNIDGLESINAIIRDCEIPAEYSVPLEIDPSIELIEGHIKDINDIDSNRINIDLTNNLFSFSNAKLPDYPGYISGAIKSSSLFDPSGNSLVDSFRIDIGESFNPIILSDYSIKNEDGGPVDSLDFEFEINIPNQEYKIEFGNNYGLDGEGVTIKTTVLDTLKVNLNEFSSPDINMGSVPSGLDGFDLPYLTFNISLYNQIDANMKLYLDLYGIDDEDTLKIHLEPDISFLDILTDLDKETDSLTVSFFQDEMSVFHTGNGIEHAEPVITMMDNKISDLFAYDIINVSGYAVMDGVATLSPGKKLWGDIEILIHPLTIVIEDPDAFGFVADNFTPLSVMDRTMATKIDSGLVSATIDMNLDNQVPFAGNLLMYISNNSEYFPDCIDTLVTGSIDDQIEISDICKSNISNYIGCQEFIVDTSSNFVNHLDCVSDNGTIYYQSLLNIDFPAPPLGPDGTVLDSILNQQEIILDDEVYYFTRDNIQYLIPRFVFNSELNTITLQPDNSLKINSSIVFRLLSTGLLEEEE